MCIREVNPARPRSGNALSSRSMSLYSTLNTTKLDALGDGSPDNLQLQVALKEKGRQGDNAKRVGWRQTPLNPVGRNYSPPR